MNWYLEVLKKYAVFGGRARRKEWGLYTKFDKPDIYTKRAS